MTRMPPIPADGSTHPSIAAVFERYTRETGGLNSLYLTLANAPHVLPAYSELARTLRHEGRTPRALRELMILRIAACVGSDYEWSHHHAMALAAGVSAEQIAELDTWRNSDLFDATQRAGLRCAEEIHDHALSDAAFDELSRLLDPPQVVELVLLCAFYEAVARVIQALGIEVEPEFLAYRR